MSRSSDYVLCLIVGMVIIYCFVVPFTKQTTDSLNQSAELITAASGR